MDLPKKPILCLDFDGVIHSYASGWKGADVIPDPPVPGAIEALLRYLGCGDFKFDPPRDEIQAALNSLESFTVCIVTSRFNAWQEADGRIAVWDWLRFYGIPGDMIRINADQEGIDSDKINLCATKPAAFLTIDDRGWTFDGTFPAADQIKAFRTWQKRGV